MILIIGTIITLVLVMSLVLILVTFYKTRDKIRIGKLLSIDGTSGGTRDNGGGRGEQPYIETVDDMDFDDLHYVSYSKRYKDELCRIEEDFDDIVKDHIEQRIQAPTTTN